MRLVVLEAGVMGNHLLADSCFNATVAAKESGDEQVAHFEVAKPGKNAPSASQDQATCSKGWFSEVSLGVAGSSEPLVVICVKNEDDLPSA